MWCMCQCSVWRSILTPVRVAVTVWTIAIYVFYHLLTRHRNFFPLKIFYAWKACTVCKVLHWNFGININSFGIIIFLLIISSCINQTLDCSWYLPIPILLWWVFILSANIGQFLIGSWWVNLLNQKFLLLLACIHQHFIGSCQFGGGSEDVKRVPFYIGLSSRYVHRRAESDVLVSIWVVGFVLMRVGMF